MEIKWPRHIFSYEEFYILERPQRRKELQKHQKKRKRKIDLWSWKRRHSTKQLIANSERGTSWLGFHTFSGQNYTIPWTMFQFSMRPICPPSKACSYYPVWIHSSAEGNVRWCWILPEYCTPGKQWLSRNYPPPFCVLENSLLQRTVLPHTTKAKLTVTPCNL